MELNSAVDALAGLAQSSRLLVFKALVQAGPEGLQPSAMATQLGIPANTLSFHLRELLSAGLVTQERRGRALLYRADFERMTALIGFLTVNCCGGAPCGLELTPPRDPQLEPCR